MSSSVSLATIFICKFTNENIFDELAWFHWFRAPTKPSCSLFTCSTGGTVGDNASDWTLNPMKPKRCFLTRSIQFAEDALPQSRTSRADRLVSIPWPFLGRPPALAFNPSGGGSGETLTTLRRPHIEPLCSAESRSDEVYWHWDRGWQRISWLPESANWDVWKRTIWKWLSQSIIWSYSLFHVEFSDDNILSLVKASFSFNPQRNRIYMLLFARSRFVWVRSRSLVKAVVV